MTNYAVFAFWLPHILPEVTGISSALYYPYAVVATAASSAYLELCAPEILLHFLHFHQYALHNYSVRSLFSRTGRSIVVY